VAIQKFAALISTTERISESQATPEMFDSSVLFEFEVRKAADIKLSRTSNSGR
jgi:hypothetical protein